MRIAWVALLVGVAWAESGEQRAWMVFGKTCLKAVRIGEKTELRMPMVDGEPDVKHASLVGAMVEYDERCGRYEIERVK